MQAPGESRRIDEAKSLGLWVKPKAEFERHFEDAARGNGFYMTHDDRPTF